MFKSNAVTQENLDFKEMFSLPNSGLKAYFDKVRKGNDVEYRTNFYRHKSVSDVLRGWENTLKAIADKWPSLYEYEVDLRAKVGPMSIQKPLDERMDDIESYYSLPSNEAEPISDKALKAVLSEWSCVRGIAVKSHRATVESMVKSTNSGSPYFRKRRDVVNDTVPFSFTETSKGTAIVYPNGSLFYPAAVLGWRGQEGGPSPEDTKQRVVWMFPFAVNIAELSVYQPLIAGAQAHSLVPAWISQERVDQTVTQLFKSKERSDLVVCTDFTKFDQHFNAQCQSAAKSLLAEILNNSNSSREWLERVFPIKYNIPLAYDWDNVRYGTHGMGSGSGGTNADETLVHRALQYEAAQSNSQRLNQSSMCLGDDGILTYPGISVEQVVEVYTKHGLDMNLDKQYASKEDCTYLRRWYHQDYVVDGVNHGVYSTYRALGRLCEQERFYDPETWGKEMVALRQLSILENVKYHPLKEQFVDYCVKGDQFRLGLDIPGFFDDLSSIARESIDLHRDFLGYNRSNQADAGIDSWWVVNYLKSNYGRRRRSS